MKTLDKKYLLLAGTAVVAAGFALSAPAFAADAELAAAEATPTDLSLTLSADADSILNAVDDTDDFGELDVEGGETIANINSDYTGGVAFYDGTTGGDTLTVTGYVDVADSTTLEVFLGGSEQDGTGTQGFVDVDVAGSLGESGGSTLTRGGTIDIQSVAELSATSTLDIAGNTLMTNIDVTAAAGGTAAGSSLTVTFGDDTTDTFNVTTLDVTAGNGSGSADVAGGDAAVVVNGAATIGGAVTVTGGDDAAGGASADGGAASLDFNGDVTSTSTLAVSSGTASSSGANGNASVNFAGDVTFTGITLEEGDSGTATLTFDGTTGTQYVTGDIDGASGAEGIVNVTGAASVVFYDKVGDDTAQGIDTLTLNGAGDTTVTFYDDIDATTFTVGGGTTSGNTNTVTFNTTNQAFEVVTALVAADTTETDAIIVSGDDILTQSAAWGAGGGIDSLTISGTATLNSDADITVSDGDGLITIGSNATLDAGAGAIAATTIANSGTLQITGTGGITAAITGTGTLDVDEDATITGNIAASTATVADTKTLTVDGDYAVTTTTLTSTTSGGITFTTGGGDITGNIVAAATDTGLVTFTDVAATTAIEGNIGTSSVKVEDLTITSGTNAAVITTTGSLYVNDIDVGQADELHFIGTGTQYVTGTIDEASGGGSIIEVGDGSSATPTVVFSGVIGGSGNVEQLIVNDGATATFDASATFDGALSADAGTVEVAAGSTLTAASQTDGDVITWNIGVSNVAGGAQTNGTVILSGDAIDVSDDTIHFIVSDASDVLTTGASVLTDVFQGTGTSVTTGATVTDNSYLYSFALVGEVDGNIDVTISQANSIASTSTTKANTAVGNKLLTNLASSTNTEINQVQAKLVSAGSAQAVNDVLEAATSDVSGGAVLSGLTVASQSNTITGTRLASLRDGSATAGMAAGDLSDGVQVWAQAFGQTATQDERDGVAGYDADTYGFIAGIDTEAVAEDLTLGLAVAYANTEVDSEASDSAETEVDSYQITLYGDYDINDRTYVSGQIGYIFGENDTSRQNVGGVSSLDVTGDFDSDVFVASAEVGHDYTVDHGITLTPKATVNYVHYEADGYTETGAGGASAIVGDVEVDVLEFGVALDATTVHSYADGSYIKPKLSLGVRHDVIGDEVETTNQFVGGGTAFTVEGFDPAQTTFDVGVGVTYFTTDNWEFSGQYGYEFKEDYDAHTGSLKAAYKF